MGCENGRVEFISESISAAVHCPECGQKGFLLAKSGFLMAKSGFFPLCGHKEPPCGHKEPILEKNQKHCLVVDIDDDVTLV